MAVVVVLALFLRRSPGSPGWGAFLLGLLIPEVAFFINRLFTTEISIIFLVAVAVLVLIPMPSRRPAAVAR